MKTKYFFFAFLLLFYVTKSNGQNVANYCFSCGGPPGLSQPTCEDGFDLAPNAVNFDFANSTSLAPNQGDVVIGSATSCSANPRAKLDVTQQPTSSANGSIAILGENADYSGCGTGNGPVIAIKGLADGSPSSGDTRIGGWFEADVANNCCGTTGTQCAIWIPNGGGSECIGFGIGSACSTIASGNLLNINGSAISNAWNIFSDTTLKKNITRIDNTLSLVCRLHAINFEWKEHYDAASEGAHYGFIAQEVATVFPDAVRKINGHLAMSYNDMIPLLTVAIQQEKQTNDSLRSQVQSLTQRFNQLIGSGSNGSNQATGNSQDITLSSSNSPLLYQNMPNPFSSGTKINYFLPEGTSGATIVFIDSYGNQLKTVGLSQTGNGTINVSSENLSAGIYSYSLMVNGRAIDTKKMILQK